MPRGPDPAEGGHWAGRADSNKHGRTTHACLMGDRNNEVPNRGVTVNGWGVWGERQDGMEVADYSTHERGRNHS